MKDFEICSTQMHLHIGVPGLLFFLGGWGWPFLPEKSRIIVQKIQYKTLQKIMFDLEKG